MDDTGRRSQGKLARLGRGQGVALLLSGCTGHTLDDDHPICRLFEHERTTRDDFEVPPALELLDVSLARIAPGREGLGDWLSALLKKVWAADHSEACGALAELEAFGAFSGVFPDCVPVPRSRQATPDIEVRDHFFTEVYCPRESEPNREAVARDLKGQRGPVRIAVSYPVTGQGGSGIRYAANKVADRLLNKKRSSKQFCLGTPSILYVNARHEWGLCADDLLPMRSVLAGDVEVVGTFGAWHAFYGKRGIRSMLSGPASLPFLLSIDAYEQQVEGLFRAECSWSGALVAVRDGIVLFENPWAASPLQELTLRTLTRLHRFRPEYSWYRGDGARQELEMEVERAMAKLKWTFSVPSGSE